MNRRKNDWWQGIVGVALLATLAAGLVVMVQRMPTPVKTRQGSATALAQAEALPSPVETIEPSPTPFPTFTPWPTPTRKPGPTATALPLPTPFSDAAGVIRYVARINHNNAATHAHFAIGMDARGNAKAGPGPIALPPKLGFTPYQIFVSPNGLYTVYMQGVEPGGRPYIYNKTSQKINVLFERYSGGSFFGWHPDGRRFLFWIDGVGLMLVDSESLEVVMLDYPNGPVQGAAISPDGLTVAYIPENPPVSSAVWFVSTAGSDARLQFDAGGSPYLYSTAWSPDNSHLLYWGNCPEPSATVQTPMHSSLCLFDTKTHSTQGLKLPYVGFAPVWSPDGHYIAATGATPGEQECSGKGFSESEAEKCLYQGRSIYVIDVGTGAATALTPGIAPIWSPDGAQLAFLSNRTGSPETWRMSRDGQALAQLTHDGFSKEASSLSWYPEVKQ